MATVSPPHIHLNDRGVAWIDDTNIKVIEVALEMIAHGSSPDEIYEQHDGYLSMAQIYSALAYYCDHQQDFDAEIDRQVKDFDQRHAAAQNSPLRRRLRSAGKLP